MSAIDATQGNAILNAILRQSATASTTGINVRLGTNLPTASVDMTELSGTGYVTGGSACTFAAASGEASSNTSTLTWTNGGSSWTINGIELWDQAGSPVRWLFGAWTGAPITVANGNSFSVAAGGIQVSITLCSLMVTFC